MLLDKLKEQYPTKLTGSLCNAYFGTSNSTIIIELGS